MVEIFTVPFIEIGEYQNSKLKQNPAPTLGQKTPQTYKKQRNNKKITNQITTQVRYDLKNT